MAAAAVPVVVAVHGRPVVAPAQLLVVAPGRLLAVVRGPRRAAAHGPAGEPQPVAERHRSARPAAADLLNSPVVPRRRPVAGARTSAAGRRSCQAARASADRGSCPAADRTAAAAPTQLPSGGGRPNIGGPGRPTQLPSTRPDIGGRPGVGGRPGISQLPALGAGAAIGAGLGNRPGTLPGLGEGRPSQLPARTPDQRRDDLHGRLDGDNRPGQPARDWGEVRQDWQSNRDEIRNDWQQYRDVARDDWQDFFDDHYGRYGGWYAGYAPGYWGRWDHLWDNYPVAAAVGVTWWGANGSGLLLRLLRLLEPLLHGEHAGLRTRCRS